MNWPDWITAASTLLTAAFMGAATWRDRQRRLPVFEVYANWDPAGVYLDLSLVITNRLDETIEIYEARMRTPKEICITKPLRYANGAEFDYSKEKFNNYTDIDILIGPAGSIARVSMIGSRIPPDRRDMGHIHLVGLPPEGWDGGLLEVEIALSSRGGSLRSKRVSANVQLHPKPRREVATRSNTIPC